MSPLDLLTEHATLVSTGPVKRHHDHQSKLDKHNNVMLELIWFLSAPCIVIAPSTLHTLLKDQH